MISKLAQQARKEVIAATQRLTPEQRLQAFVQHCQTMVELYRAGCLQRAQAAAQSLDRPLVRKLAARFGKQPARLLENLLAKQGAAE